MHSRFVTSILVAVVALAMAVPATAGPFTLFDDVGELTQHLLSGGPPRDGIPSMTNPAFARASRVTYIRDEDMVVGVVRNGVAKAYPENLGWWHEIINDEIGGEFISVSLCPLTGTPMVFDATDVDGSQFEFGVSGLLINSNLVMYDRRDDTTLFPQMIYTAINGDRKGEQLELLPAIETTFGAWKRMYPDSDVALFGTGLERYPAWQSASYQDAGQFLRYPYGDYRVNDGYFVAPMTTGDPDLSFYASKEIVTGLCINDEVRAYPMSDMAPKAVVNDELGGEPVLVAFELATRASIPYSRVVDGRTLTFYQIEPEGDLPLEFRDVETGTRWDLLGRGLDGPLAGRQLEQLPAFNSMWFAWSTYYPNSSVWASGDGIIEAPPVTAVLEPHGAALPDGFGLQQNYPNPFNPDTRIQFTLPTAGEATLTIYNAAGQRVRQLADGHHRAGLYLASWDGMDDSGRSVASGTYHYRLQMPAAGHQQTRVMTLAR